MATNGVHGKFVSCSTNYLEVSPLPLAEIRAISASAKLRAFSVTFTEAGLQALEGVGTWFGVIAPAGTQKVIIDKMSAEIGRYIASPDFKEMLVSQGMTPFFSTSGQFSALLKADLARFTSIIKAANIKMEN